MSNALSKGNEPNGVSSRTPIKTNDIE